MEGRIRAQVLRRYSCFNGVVAYFCVCYMEQGTRFAAEICSMFLLPVVARNLLSSESCSFSRCLPFRIESTRTQALWPLALHSCLFH